MNGHRTTDNTLYGTILGENGFLILNSRAKLYILSVFAGETDSHLLLGPNPELFIDQHDSVHNVLLRGPKDCKHLSTDRLGTPLSPTHNH